MKLSVRGVSILFASGDQGVCGREGCGFLKHKFHPDFPAASPYITAVGGTDFETKGVIGAETAWSAGGGGFSGGGGASVSAQFGGAAGASGASASVAHFLARHQERFASCKVSQLKRAVAELAAGVKRILDAGRVRDPAVAKGLRESMKKMGDVKLLQGVVERPRARREVVAHLEAAVKMCRARGA